MIGRGALLRVLWWVGLIVYSAAFAEVFIRVFVQQPLLPRYVTGTAWGVRGNVPNARYWIHTPEVDVPYRINALGMRANREYPFDKPPGTCRVAMFGDSFFFGVEVSLGDSLAGQLERKLREHGVRAEVLNFAVGGFGTAEMLRTYEAFGRRFDPDVVIFSWDFSDPADNVRSGLYRLADGRLERANAVYLPGVGVQDFLMRFGLYRLLADHSELYAFLREKAYELARSRQLHARGGAGPAEPAPADGEDEDDVKARNKQYAIELSSALLLRAHDEAVANGSEFLLVDIPIRVSRVNIRSSARVLPPAVSGRLQIVSATAALSRLARPDRKLFFEKGQGHLTPQAVDILSGKLVDALLASPRLAACSPAGGGRLPHE
jgi:hypothetical protein